MSEGWGWGWEEGGDARLKDPRQLTNDALFPSHPASHACRLSYLENDEYDWKVTVHTLPKPSVSATGVPDGTDPSQVHYIYVCQKRA